MFCDDIRRELGNKMTLVGCYGSDLVLDELPVALPRLCVMARVITPVGDPVQKLVVRVRKGDAVIGELGVSEEQIANNPKPQPTTRWLVHTAVFEFSPLFIETECKIGVEAETERETHSTLCLKVLLSKNADLEESEAHAMPALADLPPN
jgi:hypothetical protein